MALVVASMAARQDALHASVQLVSAQLLGRLLGRHRQLMGALVLTNGDVFDTSTFMDKPTMIVAAKLTPYGHTLARIASQL